MTPPPLPPLTVAAYTLTSALGLGLAAQTQALLAGQSGLSASPFETCTLPCYTGQVAGLASPLPAAWADWDCRNNRLAELGLQQDDFLPAVAAQRQRLGAARIGVFVGTSTAGVQQTERAYRAREDGVLPAWFNYRTSQNTFSVAHYVQSRLGLSGPCVAISTACSSSSKVFAAAQRAIAAGLCDAAVVGGVDSLCLTTLYGFNALQLLSPEPCRPADVARRGISIGEAAGFALLLPSKPLGQPNSGLCLLGYGESSDAHHMSTPHPEGRGAAEAMQAALQRGGVAAVDFVHLHGTATPANDLAEDQALCTVLGTATPCASTKGAFGHTLGAAGMVSAAVALLAIEQGFLPASQNTQTLDPQLRGHYVLSPRRQPVQRVLTNAFGFGGNNCSLLFGDAA